VSRFLVVECAQRNNNLLPFDIFSLMCNWSKFVFGEFSKNSDGCINVSYFTSTSCTFLEMLDLLQNVHCIKLVELSLTEVLQKKSCNL